MIYTTYKKVYYYEDFYHQSIQRFDFLSDSKRWELMQTCLLAQSFDALLDVHKLLPNYRKGI